MNGFDPNDPWGLNKQQNPFMQGDPAMTQQPPPQAAAAPMGGAGGAPGGAAYQMDPTVMQAMMKARNPAAAAKVQQQQKLADMMRSQGAKLNSGGQMVGGRYIGPNALTALAQGLGGYMGSKQDALAEAGMQTMQTDQNDADARLIQALSAQRRGGGGH